MKKLMAANWKMYKTLADAEQTARSLVQVTADLPEDREVMVFPPFTAIASVVEAFAGNENFIVGGQNCYPAEEGAFTGEISPRMLLDLGCRCVLTGHSERRHVLGEFDEFVGRKTAFALKSGLHTVLCIGETLEEREAGALSEVLTRQLKSGLGELESGVNQEVLSVAYEPVWAIGTGKTAGPPEITEAHGMVRAILQDILPNTGAAIRILYGGSVKPGNIGEIITLDNVEGVLVGGASLQADSFSQIVLG
ncbi:MAG: triose-phosphate isomerase [Oceanidesulfovibrio sp.]